MRLHARAQLILQRRRRLARSAAGVTLAALGACLSDRAVGTGPNIEADLSRVEAGGGAGSNPTVTSTNPPFAPQDTTLDVHVFGTGFTKGAKATWSLNGDTTRVHVNSTKLIGSTELVANLAVPSDAPVASYDVVVTLSTGKKGIGAELFAVTQGNSAATWAFPLADAGLSLKSDRQYSDGTYSRYADGVCSVESTIFVPGTGDNTISFTYPKGRKGACGRKWTLAFPDGYAESLAYSGGLQVLANNAYSIPVGSTALRHLRIGMKNGLSNPTPQRCSLGLVFGPGGANPALGSDSVQVTRIDPSTWRVHSQAPPNDHAYCIDNGQLYELQVDFLIISARPLP